MENLENEKLESVSGGAKLMEEPKKVKCLFHCKRCGETWEESVANPED